MLGAISLDLFAVLFGGATALLPVYAADVLHVGPSGLGLLRTAPGIGAAVCGLAIGLAPISRQVGRWMFGGVIAFGVATVIFGLSQSFWLSLAALTVMGAGDMVSVYIRHLLVQLETPDEIRGRVSAVNAVFIGASNELGRVRVRPHRGLVRHRARGGGRRVRDAGRCRSLDETVSGTLAHGSLPRRRAVTAVYAYSILASCAGRIGHRLRKGRGAVTNPAGRFEGTQLEATDDGWGSLDEPPRRVETVLAADVPRHAITRNQSPDVPFDQSVNPYQGCEHGCIYCFARPSHSYWNLGPGLDFETRIFHKPGLARLLDRELSAPGYVCKPINLGANTDPYQPAEREHRTTRELLEVLLAHRHPVTIVTKGALVLRDLDLLADLARPRASSRSSSASPRSTTNSSACSSRARRRRRRGCGSSGRLRTPACRWACCLRR